VVISPVDLALSQGDAGWTKRGAFVAMQEKALERLGGHAMGAPPPLPVELLRLGVDRPHIAFSEVLTFDMNGDSIHVVHQPSGCSNADSIVHFHTANVVYLGEVFPGDGYPEIDSTQGGTVEGVIETLSPWTDDAVHIVPARGDVTTGASVRAFRDMIVAVRDRVKKMIDSGRTERQIMAAHPTKEFDQLWGHGQVPPDTFVHEIYIALTAGG
jgi:hypothetical protein